MMKLVFFVLANFILGPARASQSCLGQVNSLIQLDLEIKI
jgi:hypothetical protein